MKLAEPYRSVILLRYLDELPMAEVARRTQASETTVRKRVATGLDLLRKALDRELGPDSNTWALTLLGGANPSAPTAAASHAGLLAVLQGVLLMNVKWVAACAASVLVALVAWHLGPSLHHRTEGLTPLRGETDLTALVAPKADGSRQEVPIESALGRAQTIDASSSGPCIVVRSSVGLTLPYVDVQDALGDWRRADLDHDRCAIDASIPFPRMVRAPGHVPQAATRVGQELALEPDALLTLEAPGLRSAARTIRVENHFDREDAPLRPEIQRACASGFLSDDKWCVAVSCALYRAFVSDETFDVEVLWPDHRRADVHVLLVPGTRATWTVPKEREAGSPLRVHVRRPTGETAGDVRFLLAREGDGDVSTTQRFAWGTVVLYPRSSLWMDEQRMRAASSDFTFDFVPSGVPLRLAARDETSSAFERIAFVHDGSERTIDLRPAFVLVGKLVAADDRAPVTGANLIWAFHGEPELEYLWRFEGFPVATDPSGRFEARGPKNVTTYEGMPLDRPSHLRIEVDAPGFVPFVREVDTAGARRFDCGDLLLARLTPQLSLAPGHGLAERALNGEQMWTSASPDVEWDVRGGSMQPDGSMAVFLQRIQDGEHAGKFQTYRQGTNQKSFLEWPTQQPQWITLHVLLEDHDESRLFELQGDGRYAPVPRRDFELDLKLGALPPDGSGWRLGWQRREQYGWLGVNLPDLEGEMEHVRFSMPVGAQLWWSTTAFPPGWHGTSQVGGSIALDGTQARLVLR
jgi:hypothetical protein